MKRFKTLLGSTSYREAQAWVFFAVNTIVMMVYGAEVLANPGFFDGQGLPALAGLIIVGVCTTFFTILLIIPTAIIFNQTANEKADERDRRIKMESGAMAFWTFFFLTSLSLIGYVFHGMGDLMFHMILMTILIVQLVYAFGIAVKYRRSSLPFSLNAQD